MRLKIVGIGKCGIRIAYDFFAHTRGLPSAYEIRIKQRDGMVRKLADKLRIQSVLEQAERFRIMSRQFIQDFQFTESTVAESPRYATIDSDSENNEVVKEILVSRQAKPSSQSDLESEKPIIFPGRNYDLNNHRGGCDYHIVSENIACQWTNIPEDVWESKEINIYVTSFSIGGGTGGGSAPIVSNFAKLKGQATTQALCHYMGLGVLPKSDERYRTDELALNMADYEKFSAGRFMVSLYGKRLPGSMDSLWLFSNDSMRFLVDHDEEKKQLANKKGEVALNLSMVNTYVARSLGILSNCSSVATKADTNPDPRELNYKLDQQPFISGMSQVRVEKSNTSEDHLLTVRRLLELALTNVTQESGLLSGLSVPVYHEHLEGLRRVLRSPHTEDQAFLEQLEQYNLESGPIEFSMAERVVIIYGQPDKHYSVHKKHLIEHACGKFFSNSQFVSYSFRHPWDFDQLLILIVDPMIMPVASSIYYYINNAWGNTDENLRDKLDAVINSPRFDKNQLTNVIGEKEQFPEIIYGPGTQDIQNNLTRTASLAVTRDQVIRALEHVHHIYYRKRPDLETSPRFRRRPIASL